jgi:hypothetical protein
MCADIWRRIYRRRMDRRLRDAGHLVGTLAFERAMQHKEWT